MQLDLLFIVVEGLRNGRGVEVNGCLVMCGCSQAIENLAQPRLSVQPDDADRPQFLPANWHPGFQTLRLRLYLMGRN